MNVGSAEWWQREFVETSLALSAMEERAAVAEQRLAIAWDEGYSAGVEDEARWENCEVARPDQTNPYAPPT